MKTVFGEVMEGEVKTETGTEIDAIFSYSSIQARIVESPIVIGTTATLLSLIGKKAFEIYKS